MSIRAVVFDMDGVLFDSEPLWFRARQAFAADLGRRWTEADHAALMGCNVPEWSVRMRDGLGVRGLSASAVAAEVLQRVRSLFERELKPFAGTAQTLGVLGRHWPLALATGSPRELVECALACTGLSGAFQAVFCGDEVPRGKPHPDIYLAAIQAMGVKPFEAVGIEDSPHGLSALRSAGLWAIALHSNSFGLSEAARAMAHAEVNDITEVATLLAEGWPRADRDDAADTAFHPFM